MNGKTLIFLIIGLVSGIMIGDVSAVPPWVCVIPFLLAFCCYVASIIRSSVRRLRRSPILYEAVATLLFQGVGIFSATTQRPATVDFVSGTYQFSGTVTDYTPTNWGDRLLVKLSSLAPVDGSSVGNEIDVDNVSAFITLNDASPVSYGSRISGLASLKSSLAPGNTINHDYDRYLKNKGILLSGFADTGNYSIKPSSFSILSFLSSLRYDLEAVVESSRLSSDAKSFLISVLLGDKSYVDRKDRLTFTDAGVAHIFAVSGFHVSMIALFTLGILTLFFHGRASRWKFLLTVPLIWFYILLVGASPATCRAGIMISFGMCSLFLQRKNNPLKALGWAIILILAFYPGALLDIGFQLSIVCVGSLLLIARPLNFITHRGHPLLYKTVGLILVTLTASFTTWILCAYYFHRFSLMFLPLNLLAVPALPAYIALSLLYLVLSACGLEFSLLASLLDYLYALFHEAAASMSEVSAPFINLHPHSLSVFLWIGGVILLAVILQLRKPIRRLWLPVGVLGCAVVSLALLPANSPSGLIVQKNSTNPSIMCYHDGQEKFIDIPQGVNSFMEINGRKILAIASSDLLSPSVKNKMRTADLIILCHGVKNLDSGLVESLSDGCLLSTHPGIHWRYERNILSQASALGRSIHSIRYDGPLHLFD